MKTDIKRRTFVGKCFKAGVAGCALLYGDFLLAKDDQQQVQKPDPKSLTYCGYKCTTSCTLYKATIENNAELRKKAYEEFGWKDKFKLDYDASKVFCWGCKTKDKPLSINVKACTVRVCAIEKKHDCCIECSSLATCDKEFWKTFPTFKTKVMEMQKAYRS